MGMGWELVPLWELASSQERALGPCCGSGNERGGSRRGQSGTRGAEYISGGRIVGWMGSARGSLSGSCTGMGGGMKAQKPGDWRLVLPILHLGSILPHIQLSFQDLPVGTAWQPSQVRGGKTDGPKAALGHEGSQLAPLANLARQT